MLKIFKFFLFPAGIILLPTSVHGFELPISLLYQKNGMVAGNNFGQSVAIVGDVNGDGKADFIVGAPGASPNAIPLAGSAYVYSGATGNLLFQKDGADSSDQFGISVAGAGDVDGDGKADFIIGAPLASPSGVTQAGSAYVYSGATGALLYQKDGNTAGDYFGWSVDGVGNIDNDGKSDFTVGAPAPTGVNGLGTAYVYSGGTGTLLYQKTGSSLGDRLGISVAGAGDVDGDGAADFIIGAQTADPGNLTNAGSAYVYSGATGVLLFQKNGASPGDAFGLSVAGIGDINSDGKSDFIVGAPNADPGGLGEAGSAYIYSGATGVLLFQKNGASSGDVFGLSVAGTGDIDGDGIKDFIIGAVATDSGGITNSGSIYVYSGTSGVLLFQKNGTVTDEYFGWSISGGKDINGDGRSDFIVGAWGARPGGLINAGSAFIYGPCSHKGDMNADSELTASDVVLMLNCVFLGVGQCALCFADVSCNGILSSSDVVIELNAVFLGEPIGCQQ